MKEESSFVSSRIKDTVEKQIISLHLPEDTEKDLRQSINLIVSQRLGSSLQKPYIYLLCIDILGAEVDELDYDRAAAIELLNIATYQENTAIDSKFRTLTHLQKSKQYICAALTREWAKKLLESRMPTRHDPLFRNLDHLASTVYSTINAGQIFDLNLTIDNLAMSEEDYLSKYIYRCELLSGVFNSKIATLAAMAHDKDENADLESALKAFGIGLQITNDFGDNINLTTGHFSKRSYQSSFSDLKNGRLTYPLYIFFKENRNHTNFLSRDPVMQDELLNDFGKSFIRSSAMEKTRQLIKRFYYKAISHLRCLNESKSRDILMTLTSVILWNKYYTEVRLQREKKGQL
jgi:hypothetical protein